MLRPIILALGLSAALFTGVHAEPAVAYPPPPRTLVVDDDGAQCGQRAYTTIQSAVTAARRGDRVQVCPGRYAERVLVNKPLTLTGQPGALAALDCFTEPTSDPDDLDTTVVPVLEPPDEEETPVLRLAADRIEVSGMVIQGVNDQEPDIVGDGYTLFDAALTTDDAHAGWRIHDNLFRLNYLAAELGSNGRSRSRFDHNCLRDNEFAGANQRYALTRALLDHNDTFRSGNTAWEIGWGYHGTSAVTLDHNTSRHDALAVYAQNDERLTVQGNVIQQAGTAVYAQDDHRLTVQGNVIQQADTAVDARDNDHLTLQGNRIQQAGTAVYAQDDHRLTVQGNVIEQAGIGIYLTDGDTDARILRNILKRTTAGPAIVVAPGPGASPVTGLVVRGNTIIEGVLSGFTTTVSANLTGATIAENTFSRNQRSGLILASGSRANRLVGNVTEGNGQYGIRLSAGTEGNQVNHNRMLDNGLADAIDETAVTTDGVTVLANRWTSNTCRVDIPAGDIC